MSTPVRLPASRAGTAGGAVTSAGLPRPLPPPAVRGGPAAAPAGPAGPAPQPLRLAVVGAGRAGRAVATALAAAGHHVVAVASRTPATARGLAGTLAARPQAPAAPRLCASPRDAAAGAVDLVLVAVPDAAIAGVVAALLPALRPGQVVAHLSGAHGTAVLAP
ncbi:MAG TPA: NAD(P)-binding domain-containing protein, partial [Pilimelia sp.]|nr:NAD(P)-binding domain-containing protein [Pilimelia sp.]